MINKNRPPLVNRSNNMGGPNKGIKQLVIKPFKTQPKLPINFENDTWEKLKSALIAVHSKTSTIISKEELYRVIN
jgi:cullin-4